MHVALIQSIQVTTQVGNPSSRESYRSGKLTLKSGWWKEGEITSQYW